MILNEHAAGAPEAGEPLNEAVLDRLFRNARTANAWTDRPVTTHTLRSVYDLLRLCPTSMNSCPGRFIFVRSTEAKARLAKHAMDFNKEKVLAAPVTAIIGHDPKYFEKMDRLVPHAPHFVEYLRAAPSALTEEQAFRNGTLQGAYLIMAARSLGLDTGPMSGFDNAGVDADFFPDGRAKSNFICSLGYGDSTGLRPRLPRLEFEEACEIV